MKAKAKKLTRYQNEGEVTKTKNRKNILGQNVYKEKGTNAEGQRYKFKRVTDNQGDEIRKSYKTMGRGDTSKSKMNMSDYDQKTGDDTSTPTTPGRANIMITPGMDVKKKGGSISKMKPMMKKGTAMKSKTSKKK